MPSGKDNRHLYFTLKSIWIYLRKGYQTARQKNQKHLGSNINSPIMNLHHTHIHRDYKLLL